MKAGEYLGAIIIIISISLLWFRTGDLENHANILAHKCQDLQYQMDVLTELQRQMK